MEKDKKLETYYDHYKETCTLSKSAQERRNRNFVSLCTLEAVSFLMTWNPELICGLLNDAAKKKMESTIQISTSIIQTMLWILIAYILVRYVQDVLYIERQAGYLEQIEKRVSELLGDNLFSREGENYAKRRLGVEYCVSDIRQSQEWRCRNRAEKGLNALLTSAPEARDGMRASA